MDYTELVATIKSYAENTFPDTLGTGGLTSTEQIDTFIQQAEERIFNSIELLDLRKNVTGTCTASNKYLSAPSDWLATYSIAVIDPATEEYTYLLDKDVSYIRSAFPSPLVTGMPTYYGFFDENTFILGPTPDLNYTIELHYFYYPESIVTATTSWLGDNFSSVLLYGALLEANRYMKGEEDVMTAYQKSYDEAMALLKQLADGKNRTDMYRTLAPRYPVT